MIVDVSAGHEADPPKECPVLNTRSATITGSPTPPGVNRRPGGELLGLRPRTSPPEQFSHPDCRAVLILIDAPQIGLHVDRELSQDPLARYPSQYREHGFIERPAYAHARDTPSRGASRGGRKPDSSVFSLLNSLPCAETARDGQHRARERPGTLENDAMEKSTPPAGDRYLTNSEAAAVLRLSPRTLEKLRVNGGGPRFRKFGSRVIYAREDLETWANARVCASTSDPGYVALR